MDIIDQYIAQKEDQLYRKLATVTDPEIRLLISDLNTLKRTKEILRQSTLAEAQRPLFQNGNKAASAPIAGMMTQGDATVAIIKKAGKPLHVDTILKELPNYGVHAEKQTLVSVLLKDRRKRFHRTAPNTFTVREPDAERAQIANGGPRKRTSRLPAGFSLIESIKSLLPELRGMVFSQPMIYDMLSRKYPEAAGGLQRASIAAMLGKLAERDLIEVTYKGYGSEPRQYKVKS